jgi:hypothetical protein
MLSMLGPVHVLTWAGAVTVCWPMDLGTLKICALDAQLPLDRHGLISTPRKHIFLVLDWPGWRATGWSSSMWVNNSASLSAIAGQWSNLWSQAREMMVEGHWAERTFCLPSAVTHFSFRSTSSQHAAPIPPCGQTSARLRHYMQAYTLEQRLELFRSHPGPSVHCDINAALASSPTANPHPPFQGFTARYDTCRAARGDSPTTPVCTYMQCLTAEEDTGVQMGLGDRQGGARTHPGRHPYRAPHQQTGHPTNKSSTQPTSRPAARQHGQVGGAAARLHSAAPAKAAARPARGPQKLRGDASQPPGALRRGRARARRLSVSPALARRALSTPPPGYPQADRL